MIKRGSNKGESDTNPERDKIYLEIRCRIMNAQFLPDQNIECSSVTSHFGTSRSVADATLEALTADGYLRQTLLGGYIVKRYAPGQVGDILRLWRKLATVGARSLIRQPDDRLSEQLKVAIGWSPNFRKLRSDDIETLTEISRELFDIFLHRAIMAGVIQPLKVLISLALSRQAIRSMTTKELAVFWKTLNQVALAIIGRSIAKADKALLSPMPYERSLVDMITEVNGILAAPTADFSVPLPEFHILYGNTSERPRFGLGERENV